MPKSNKFSFIQEVAKSRTNESNPILDSQEITEKTVGSEVVEVSTDLLEVPEPTTLSLASPKKVGRPPGKRSDPSYEQVTAYIRKDTHIAVKIALLQEGQGREFSELVQDLLNEFLGTRNSR